MTKKKLPADVICDCKGKCYPNPGGLMSYGYAFYRPGEQEPFHASSGSKTDNVESTNYRAYFYAVLLSLESLIEQGYSGKVIEIRTDLKGAIHQIVDWIMIEYDPYDYSLMYNQSDLLKKITEIRHNFKKVRFVWTSKEQIHIADKLASDALTTFPGGL